MNMICLPNQIIDGVQSLAKQESIQAMKYPIQLSADLKS